MTEHRTIPWAIDIIRMCEPIRCIQGGMWFGRNHNFADATFIDYGAADAFAVAAKALPALVKALEQIASEQTQWEWQDKATATEALAEVAVQMRQIARAALTAAGAPHER